jgi:hypothetical protein
MPKLFNAVASTSKNPKTIFFSCAPQMYIEAIQENSSVF